MTDRPQDDARHEPAKGFDDPTRDIRLPPVPGRPAPVVPPEWAGLVHVPEPAPTATADDASSQQPTAASPAAAPARPRIADQPTDELHNPPPASRQRTLAFAPPAAPAAEASADGGGPVHGPPGYLPPGHPQPGAAPPAAQARPQPPRRRRRTWPWVLAVLVLLALFAAAVVLAWLGGEKDNLQSFWEAAAPLGYRPG